MPDMRTTDLNYGEDYFETLDGGLGYQDSTMWEDIAHAVKEVTGYDWVNAQDVSGGMSLLDWGCAKGYLVKHLRRRGYEAWGLDISEYAISHGAPEVADHLRVFDMTDPGFGTQWEPGYFDVATCFETMEHIPHVMDKGNGRYPTVNAIVHMRDNLKPGGKLIMTICTEDQPGWDTDPTHVTIKPYDFWRELFEGNGFEYDDATVEHLTKFWLFAYHKGVYAFTRT